MELASELGLFLAKLLAVLLTAALIIGAAALVMMRSRMAGEDHLEVNHLNRKYRNMALTLQHAMQPKKRFKKTLKTARGEEKERRKQSGDRQKVYVIEFRGDLRASEVASLREEISAILQVASDEDEVVVQIESGGGTVHGYGLAASQLKRIRDRGIRLTVAIDKVAASGGYMMACVGQRIIAAPFAIVGSIGVLGQLPNFHRFLKKRDIDFEQVTAGECKRSLTLFGEIRPEDRERFRHELEETHELFKEFVNANRPQVEIDRIATGEYWYGSRALELNLVDDLKTSDDYLAEAAHTADLYQVKYIRKKPLIEKLFGPTLSHLRDYELVR